MSPLTQMLTHSPCEPSTSRSSLVLDEVSQEDLLAAVSNDRDLPVEDVVDGGHVYHEPPPQHLRVLAQDLQDNTRQSNTPRDTRYHTYTRVYIRI